MKILLVSEFYWPNLDGAALFERRLAHAMADRGHAVAVWAPAARRRSYQERDGALRVWRERSVPLAGKPGYRVSLWPYWHAFRMVRRERPDVVHIHNCSPMGLAAVLAARWYRLPVVATNHAMPENVLGPHLPGWLHRALERLIWRYIIWFHNRADYVTTPTPIALSYLVDHGLRRPSQAITNGLDLEQFKPGTGTAAAEARPPRLLYLGRVDYEKNLRIILEAAAILQPELAFEVDIIGSGNELRYLKSLARKLGVTKLVKFHGQVSEAAKLAALQRAAVFVMPSPAELQSIATMEAMACAKPVVAANAGALPNLVQHEVNGHLFSHAEAAALAAAVRPLLESATLRRRFGRANRMHMQRHHSAETCYDGYEQVYDRVRAESTSTAH